MRDAVPAEPRGGHVPFGPVVEVAPDAPAIDRLVGWMAAASQPAVAQLLSRGQELRRVPHGSSLEGVVFGEVIRRQQ